MHIPIDLRCYFLLSTLSIVDYCGDTLVFIVCCASFDHLLGACCASFDHLFAASCAGNQRMKLSLDQTFYPGGHLFGWTYAGTHRTRVPLFQTKLPLLQISYPVCHLFGWTYAGNHRMMVRLLQVFHQACHLFGWTYVGNHRMMVRL